MTRAVKPNSRHVTGRAAQWKPLKMLPLNACTISGSKTFRYSNDGMIYPTKLAPIAPLIAITNVRLSNKIAAKQKAEVKEKKNYNGKIMN